MTVIYGEAFKNIATPNGANLITNNEIPVRFLPTSSLYYTPGFLVYVVGGIVYQARTFISTSDRKIYMFPLTGNFGSAFDIYSFTMTWSV